jgi:hypothetical protein
VARNVRLKAHRAGARGVPPQLPADRVESLPFFGRTWYVHGIDYWFRRAIALLLALVGLAVACTIEYALLNIASGIGSATGRWAWRAGWATLLVASLIRPMRGLLTATRRRRAGHLLRPDWPGPANRTSGGAGLGTLARTGNTLAGAALALGIVLFFGWFVVFLIFTLQPEYGIEHDARLRLQRRHDTAAFDVSLG